MKKIVFFIWHILRSVLRWFGELGKLIHTLAMILVNGVYRTKIKYEKRPYINVVVNGPSFSEVKGQLAENTIFKNRPSIVVNFFANTPEYEVLKPDYYTLADPMFFMDCPGKSIEKVKDFYKTLNRKTTWPLTVFIPHSMGKHVFFKYSGINNELIQPVEISGIGYEGFESLRNYFYDKGFCAPRAYTVAIMAMYACVQMGYQQIDIYGLDNNYYSSLCLDEDGHPCDVMQHNGEPDTYRLLLDGKGEPISLHDYLIGLTYHLKNHEHMEKYAEYKGIKIWNHSPITMVDAYTRKLD